MRNRSAITKEDFDNLLAWLDFDRENAGKKYEEIRRSLIQVFTWNGVTEAEELADETINRVARKTLELSNRYTGDPSRYFHGVAKMVLHEYLRSQKKRVPLETTLIQPSEEPDTFEREYNCLKACLKELPTTSRLLIVKYYRKDKQSKIEHRKELAEDLGLQLNALRVRATRIRSTLQDCIQRCLEGLGDYDQ